jgi:hypothetical protein
MTKKTARKNKTKKIIQKKMTKKNGLLKKTA